MALSTAERSRRHREKRKNDPAFKAYKAAHHKKWRAKNKEYLRQKSAKWHAKHKDDPNYRAYKSQKTVESYRRHPGAVNARNNMRRSRRIQRTPKWLNAEQKQAIQRFYEDCPNGMQVDHIVPLQGQNVSGLHVPWNLQYLTPSENAAKGNRLCPV